ncbi:Serine/threonine-protein kinase PAK 6 [Entophlyctis luteolus]|nr:Serine/threonine-protein kinase PAK 6 [Entophlyctis luteolus]
MERFWPQRRMLPDTRASHNTRRHEWLGVDHETGLDVLMTMIEVSKTESENDQIRLEAQTQRDMSRMNPECIVNLLAYYINPENSHVLVTEFAEGATLSDQLKPTKSSNSDQELRLDEAHARGVAHAVLGALATLHEHYIVHRAVSPQAVFIVNGGPKLGAFKSCAEDNGYSVVAGIKGEPGFQAPEMLARKSRYGRAVDIFSTGCLIRSVIEQGHSPLAASFIADLTMPDPNTRPTALEALSHPWMLVEDSNMQQLPPEYTPNSSGVDNAMAAEQQQAQEMAGNRVLVVPEKVAGYQEWLLLVPQNGERAYFYHEPSGAVQWEHPERNQHTSEVARASE